MNQQVDERLFVDCAARRHSQCMVQFKRADGSVAMRCICDCGHRDQQERDPKYGVPA